MYLLYLDDSGSVENQDQNYLVLAGVCIFERRTHWISKKLDDLAESLFPGSGSSVEFHASEIFAGRSNPWKSMKREDRIKTILEVLKILSAEHETVKAFACAVHKPSFPNRDPMEVAFEDLCSRFDKKLKRLFHEGQTERGLIILDESAYETSMQKMARNFKTIGTRWGIINNLAEVPLFVDSRSSRLVQLADHIAYAVYRRYENSDTKYLDVILPRFDSEDDILHGLSHKQSMDNHCMCPACMSRRRER